MVATERARAQGGGAAKPSTPLAPSSTAPAPDLLRLLRGWGVTLQPVAAQGVAQRLADGMGWMDAVALAQALGATEPSPAPSKPWATTEATQAAVAEAVANAVARCRGPLLAGFTDPALVRTPPHEGAGALDAVAPFRQHHVQQQRAMAAKLPQLRAQVRELLQAASPRLAQLAQLDAVLDPALHGTLEARLAALPSMLQQRGLTLRSAAPESSPTTTSTSTSPPWPPTGWRGQLWADLQRLLQAELGLRWQPIQGLLDALQDEAEAAQAIPSTATNTTPNTTPPAAPALAAGAKR